MSIATFNLIIASREAQITGLCLIVLGIVLYYVANYVRRKFVTRVGEDYVNVNVNVNAFNQ
jgi:hypothetical protein